MFYKSFKAVFVALFILTCSSVAFALQPEDAISVRPNESVYSVLRVDDLNGLLKYVFSPENIELATPLMESGQAQIFGLISGFAALVPAKSTVVSFGIAESGPFVQLAASMPDSVREKLNKVADGSASNIDIITLLFGDAAMIFAGELVLDAKKGDKGPYYSLMDQVAIAAKDDLLLIAFPPSELENSINALENKEKRLSLSRRFDNPSFWTIHANMSTATALAGAFDVDTIGDPEEMTKLFKAPLKLELGFTPKPGSFLISCAVNIFECLADTAQFKDMKPVKGANMFLAGGGKPFLAISSLIAVNVAELKKYPEVAEKWNELIEVLSEIDITESDLEGLLNGSLSIVLGSDALLMNMNIPGGYISLTGREGTVAKLFGKLVKNKEFMEELPLIPVATEGWDSIFMVDPSVLPATVVIGVKKDTFLVGLVDPTALTKAPELPSQVTEILKGPLTSIGFIDFASIWNFVKKEFSDPASILMAMADLEDEIKAVINNILEADLSVPFFKTWSSELDSGHLEFTIVDVPKEKRLMKRVLEIVKSLNP